MTSKPTRLATSIPGFEASPLGKFSGKHCLSDSGAYIGPLPQTCPHKTHDHKLIGKASDGTWNTSPAAAYPPGLCKEIADLLATWLSQPRGGRCLGNMVQKPGPVSESDLPEEGLCEAVPTGKLFHGNLVQAAVDNSGLPMTCRWQNRPTSFADGGGLNSPGRWAPTDRGTGLSREKEDFVNQLSLLVRTFVTKQISDVKRATFQLATGHMKSMPFSPGALEELRSQWFGLLGGAEALGTIPDHQPFYLFALEETMRRTGDEDADIIARNPGDRRKFRSLTSDNMDS